MRGERKLSIFRGNVTTLRSHRRLSAGARQMFYYPSPNRLTVLLKNKQYFSSIFFRLHPSVLLSWWKEVDWQGAARWCHQRWRERENENLISLSFHPNSQTPLTDLETPPPTQPSLPSPVEVNPSHRLGSSRSSERCCRWGQTLAQLN